MAVVLLSLQPRAFASQPSFEISLGFKMSRSIVCTGQENLCCPTCCVIEFQKEPDSLKANLFPPPSSFFFPSYFDSKAITICNNNHVPGAGKLVFRSDATARADVLPTVSARERDGRSEREGGEGVVLLMRLLHAPAASLKERSRPYRFALLTAKATGRPPAALPFLNKCNSSTSEYSTHTHNIKVCTDRPRFPTVWGISLPLSLAFVRYTQNLMSTAG